MGFLDELKKLTKPYEEDEDEFVDEAEPVAPRAAERPRTNPFAPYSAENPPTAPAAAKQRPVRSREGKVVSLGGGPTGQMQVVLVTPERFEAAAEVADHLRGKRAVLVNMEATPKDVARRLVDFLSGVTYAIDGNIQKVAANTYMLTPPNVNIVGDQLDELENSGIYF